MAEFKPHDLSLLKMTKKCWKLTWKFLENGQKYIENI
jgi:hypothetical protein